MPQEKVNGSVSQGFPLTFWFPYGSPLNEDNRESLREKKKSRIQDVHSSLQSLPSYLRALEFLKLESLLESVCT